MKNLKKMIVIGASALVVGAGAAAGVAQAQPLNTAYVDSLDWRIRNAAREGRMSWGEARELRAELRSVHDLAWRNQTGQIRPWEHRRLANTVHRIEVRTGYANGYPHHQRYGYGYGR